MKLMSFNLMADGQGELDWKKRIPLAVRTIRSAEPEIFCVQEAHRGWVRALQAAFPDYGMAGVGRDNGRKRGEFCAIFFLKGRTELLDHGNFWLSETPDKPSAGWDAAENMLCSWVRIKDTKADKELLVMNTHLDRSGPLVMGNGAQLIAERASELGADLPVFAAGTWNAEPGSPVWNTLTGHGFTDARDAAADTDRGPTYHAYEPNDPSKQAVADHIFLRNVPGTRRFRTVRKTVDGILPSDHYPVITEFSFYA